MPMCPKCLSEYENGVTICADCNVELQNIVLIECENCEEKVNQLFPFCDHCGYLMNNGKSDKNFECSNHPKAAAIGVCVVCGNPVCDECSTTEGGKIFCSDDSHIAVYEDWAVAYTTSTEYEASMVKSNIEMAGIKCLVFSQKDSVFYATIGNIGSINIMVPKEDLAEAEKIVSQINEGDFSGENPENENE